MQEKEDSEKENKCIYLMRHMFHIRNHNHNSCLTTMGVYILYNTIGNII